MNNHCPPHLHRAKAATTLPAELALMPTRPTRGNQRSAANREPGTADHQSQNPAVWQVPGRSVRLVGRARESAALDALLLGVEPRCGGVLLTGPAGVGKSAVARAWLRSRQGRFPDGVLYADLRAARDQTAIYRALCGWLHALGLRPGRMPGDLEAAAGLFRALTQERQLAVLVEGAARSSLVCPLLPDGLQCAALVTSTRRLGLLHLDGISQMPVGPLEVGHAVTLLEQRAGPDRIAPHPEATARIARLCGGLPLALCVLGAGLVRDPRASWELVARELAGDDEPEHIDPETEELAVSEALDVGYRALHPAAAGLYRLLGALPIAQFTAPLAAVAANLADDEAAALLATLLQAHLLERAAAGAYRFSALTMAHARQAAVADHNAPAAVRRVITWYLASAINAAGTVRPYRRAVPGVPVADGVRPAEFATLSAALDWLEAESETLLDLARYCVERGQARTALEVTAQMWALFAYRKRYPLWESFDALGLECARTLGDRHAQARMLRRLGLLAIDQGRYQQAREHLRSAAAVFEQLGDEHRTATVLASLGMVELRGGNPHAAVGPLIRALDVHRRRGESRQVALALIDLAHAEIELGRPGAALARLREASRRLHGSPDAYTRAHLRMLRGRARTRTRAWRYAQRDLALALTAMRATGSHSGQAEALCYLAELAERTGREWLAQRHRAQASALLDQLGTPDTGWLRDRLAVTRAES